MEENIALAVDLMADPAGAYRRANARLRGLMSSACFQALHIDSGEITEGELQPVLAELPGVWINIRPRFSPRRGQAIDVVRRPSSGRNRRPELRNPQAWRRGGSKVRHMVRLRGLEPPRGFVYPTRT